MLKSGMHPSCLILITQLKYCICNGHSKLCTHAKKHQPNFVATTDSMATDDSLPYVVDGANSCVEITREKRIFSAPKRPEQHQAADRIGPDVRVGAYAVSTVANCLFVSGMQRVMERSFSPTRVSGRERLQIPPR